MSAVERKLQEYREQKERDAKTKVRQEKYRDWFTLKYFREIISSIFSKKKPLHEERVENDEEEDEEPKSGFWFWYEIIIKFSIWLVFLIFFLEHSFAGVYLLLTCFYLMYQCLGRRRAGEMSAYSVFNPGCEAIDGTLTAQHFEDQIRHRKT